MNRNLNYNDQSYWIGSTQVLGGGIKNYQIKNPSTLGRLGCAGLHPSKNIEYRPEAVTYTSVPSNLGLGYWHRGRTNIVFIDGHAAPFNFLEAQAPKPTYGYFLIEK